MELIEKDGQKILVENTEKVLSDKEYQELRTQKIAEIANLEAYILKTKQDYNI